MVFRLLVLTALLIPTLVQGQNLLKGIVTDKETNETIVGATIYLPDLKKGTVTNINGEFTLPNLPRGRFFVDIKFVGYSTFVQTIQINGTTELNVALSSSITELHEIVVTGISHTSELKNNPVPIVTMNSDELQAASASNLIDNISRKPGVSQITTGVGISKPVIRGLGYTRIISLFDGIRQEGQQWGDEHGIEIDEFSVDRVEIIKGAGSLMYGSDGLGGVINFLSANPVSEGEIHARLISNYQSNNGMFGHSIMNAGNLKGIYWQARYTNKTAGNYRNDADGRVFNSGLKENDANGFIGINKSWGYTQFNISHFNQHVGLVEGERNANGGFTRLADVNGEEEEIGVTQKELDSYKIFVPRQSIQHDKISNTTNLYFGESRLQFSAGYQRNQRKEFGNVLDENREDLYFDLNTGNANLVFFVPAKNDWQLSFGSSAMLQQNKNKGIEFLIPEYRLADWGAFGFFKKDLQNFDISGGVRFDQRHISVDALYLNEDGEPVSQDSGNEKFKSASLSFSNYSTSLGITYKVSKTVHAKLNASRGFRAPNIAELTSNGQHEGSLRYEYGNYDLKAETSLQVDGGLLINSPHVSAEISIFTNNINHYIFTEKILNHAGLDSIPDPADPSPAYSYVQGKALLTGGEVTLDIHPHPLDWLHFENNFSFVNARNINASNDSARYLPFIPAPQYLGELRANIIKSKGLLANSFVRFEYQYVWKQDRVLLESGTETPTNGYGLINVGAGTDIRNKNKVKLFSLHFAINNMLNTAYQNHLSRLKYAPENPLTGNRGVYNMGRNVSFKIIVPLVLKKS